MRHVTVLAKGFLSFLLSITAALAAEAYVRVSQVGYETGGAYHRAYLMSTVAENGASFRVFDEKDAAVYAAPIGEHLGNWTHAPGLVYRIYALDFKVPEAFHYSIAVTGPADARSPEFAVASPDTLYSGLLLNTRFFYETERDGPNYIENSLRAAPAHLNDKHAEVYLTPPLDSNDLIATVSEPLHATGTMIDASGGWWDAGDYMKYVETVSYTVALQQIGVRDFPRQMGRNAPLYPPTPPNAISYAGHTLGAPRSADFAGEAQFGIDFLLNMWDDKSKTLYYQVGNSQDWVNFDFLSDYDIWRLPQADDHWDGCPENSSFICYRPVFRAGPAGAKISPNLAGRLAASFAVCYENNRTGDASLAMRCLKDAEDIFELADTTLSDPANSVGAGSCSGGCLLTIIPFDGYPETVWSDDMELGAAELYFALEVAKSHGELPQGLIRANPKYYLAQATRFASDYISNIYNTGNTDTLNLYDVSGLAHFELYRALQEAGNPPGLGMDETGVRAQFLRQVDEAIVHATKDAWGFGSSWNSDTTSHGAGLSVMASEAFYLTGEPKYNVYAQRWLANVLGANAWGSSFIVGDGSAVFPNCIQHQVANLVGALDGTAGGTPVLWGAASEGPAYAATSGIVGGMIACPADGRDAFARFNGNSGPYNPDAGAVYQDNVQSYSTTEPAIDLTATSFLMWSWRMARAVDEGS
jgi:endoglucanase